MTLAEHTRIHGPLPRVPAERLIEEVERSGLRGRGGADFPTAVKLAGGGRGGGAPARWSSTAGRPSRRAPRTGCCSRGCPTWCSTARCSPPERCGAREVIVKVGDGAVG